MQLAFNKDSLADRPEQHLEPPLRYSVADLRTGESGELHELRLPRDFAERLMELGFVPGLTVTAGQAAPGGDPRVYHVDGANIALRAETARYLLLKPLAADRP